ncbi:FISUMP domain-containing protein [Bacteroides fragilis]|uniref:Fibrobacter succinogenes major paralogous domain protein n=1 Tax=Bacteroides fragilis str. 3783N1-6 TaxID=1339310 RepID=A0AB73AFV4_BACFG|nr:FISUMP domain-containing protein [Bacteroides fragilis]EXY49950.1 fibrobacter succinogenes major paralogous domain protein [Bacteroides fragilis str. 3783N2-1]EXY54739.1 fibrobacter succinogenes major paralogous domain protein [Bacteroides fragilis str. 3976T7]EXZ66559.1 fibrobacter succinogenes major paralogous domain protein [Bacteroides fragilis str. 3783N1-8]EYB08013.1 fibrobacter succinogenes major paralogous domain protein [Bacteroides fragilis str. 3783N1-6]
MIRKKIYLLLLLIPLLHGCKESDFNDLLDRQGDQRKELQELTDLCKKLNEDIYNLQVIVNTDRIGDNITHIEELADGAGYTISFSKSAPITIRNGKKGDTGPDGDAGKDGIDGTDGKDGVDGTDGKDGVDGTDGTDGKDGENGTDGKDGADGTNGTDGKDGVDGTDGKDGVDGTNGNKGEQGDPGQNPVVGIMQDPADSEYYWTIKIGSGEPYYLADNDGNRIKATSTVHDGQTPQLGVKQWETSAGGDDNYYWTQKIGTGPETWIEADGKKIVANAKNAVSVFEKVDLKEPDYVEFTLSGGATRFRLPIGRPVIEVPEGRKLFFFNRGGSQAIAFSCKGISKEQLSVDVPKGWKATVDFEAGALTLEAPLAGTADVALSGDVVLRSTNTAEETARTSFTVSMLYKIMLPDFRGSYVYNIRLWGKKVGELCREYQREPDFGDGLQAERLTDADGNAYRIVKIGKQYWTAENLRTLTYPDGTPVATGLSGRAWRESGFDDSGSGACAVYDYENAAAAGAFANKVSYGVLYNRVAARKVVPAGWKLPTESDIVSTLRAFLGSNAGTLLKESGTEHWLTGGGTDLTGFSGVGGGYRGADGLSFNDFQQVGIWWSSASLESVGAVFRLSANSSVLEFNSGDNNSTGYSVRLLKED